jgi:tetratricopeptide (TPR) repeat protein
LVFRRERSAFEGAEEYTFKHAILREVTYETVLLKLRRVYHAQVAAWLEANAGERLGEYLSLIAGHHERAGNVAKAVDYLRRSGEESHRVSAYRDAIRAYERALALLPSEDKADRAVLHAQLGSAHLRLDDYPLARTRLEEALVLAQDVGDVETEVAVLIWLGHTVFWQGAHAKAVRLGEKGLARAREHQNRPGSARALELLGYVAAREGKRQAAETYARESLAIYRELGDRQGVAEVHTVLGTAAAFTGDYDRGEEHIRAALAIHREIGDRGGVARRLNFIGYTLLRRSRLEEAVPYLEASLSISREIGETTLYALSNLAFIQARTGQNEAAWRTWREALAESVSLGVAASIPANLAVAAVWLAEAGQYDRAAELVGLALDRALDVEPQIESEPALVILRQALSDDELEAAMARGRELDLDAVVAELLVELGE